MITINHIAIAVSDLDEAQRFWVEALGLPLAHVEDVPAEGVRVAFIPAGPSAIELVQPVASGSGIASYMQKRGPGMHHLCLEVPDIEAAMQRLQQYGAELINETPRVADDGRRYAFIHPRSTQGVLLELYQAREDESQQLLDSA